MRSGKAQARSTAHDRLFAARTAAVAIAVLALAVGVIVATDAGAAARARAGVVCAASPFIGTLALGVAAARAKRRGELAALAAIGAGEARACAGGVAVCLLLSLVSAIGVGTGIASLESLLVRAPPPFAWRTEVSGASTRFVEPEIGVAVVRGRLEIAKNGGDTNSEARAGRSNGRLAGARKRSAEIRAGAVDALISAPEIAVSRQVRLAFALAIIVGGAGLAWSWVTLRTKGIAALVALGTALAFVVAAQAMAAGRAAAFVVIAAFFPIMIAALHIVARGSVAPARPPR